MRTGIADLPLHYGKCPKWLFGMMKKLSGEICKIIILEKGSEELLKRLSDPLFFQALGCAVGYDWHSSGLTTTLTAALKEAGLEEYGVAVFGGKGKRSRETLKEMEKAKEFFGFDEDDVEVMKRASRISAKVDNSLVQDGFQLYHHCFILDEKKRWCVVQQGMDVNVSMSRRYHWFSERIDSFVEEPHTGIVCEVKKEKVMNLTSRKSRETRKCVVELINDRYFESTEGRKNLIKYIEFPRRHWIVKSFYRKLEDLREFSPSNFEELILIRGVGPKTIRALALLSHLVFGSELSWKDPVKYSFAHGGKDGTPYPVDRRTYLRSINTLSEIIKDLEIGKREKLEALERLSSIEL